MHHIHQPQRNHQEKGQADNGDERVQQRGAYQAAAQMQALEKSRQDQATEGRDQQGETGAQADGYAQ